MKNIIHKYSKQSIFFLFIILLYYCMHEIVNAGQNWTGLESTTTFGVSNPYYTLELSKENGKIISLSKNSIQKPILGGQLENNLWNFVLNSKIPQITDSEDISKEEQKLRNLAYLPDLTINPNSPEINQFQYRWSDDKELLSLYYYSNNTVIVTIHIIPSDSTYIDFVASIYNPFPAIGLRFDFPQGLFFPIEDLKQFIYPEGIGVAFTPQFYQQNRTSYGHYPALFSDFISLESNSGNVSIFTIQKPNQFNPSDIFTGGANQKGVYEHRFINFIYPRTIWSSPTIRFVIGEDTLKALENYAEVHRFNKSMNLEKKLGKELFAQVAKSLTIKVDHRQGNDFNSVTNHLSDLPPNTLLHPVSYWKIGFDHHYPDFIPPDDSLGGPKAFLKMIQSARNKGMLIMPYINPTWWNESPSLNQLGREKIASRRLDGTIQKEWYNNNYGYVVTPTHDDVRRNIKQIITQFRKEYPIDILFEDQLGARPWLYDRNPRALHPTNYVQGIMDLTRMHSQSLPIFTERGFDQLIPHASGFCGLPNLQYPGFEGYHDSWGVGSWKFYPIALYLAHDKIAFYQHDLAVETMTESMQQLSWNIVHGFGLTVNLKSNMTEEEKQWFKFLGKVQGEICSKYLGLPLVNYQQTDKGMFHSQFGDYYILANFSGLEYSFHVNHDIEINLPQGGFVLLDSKNNPIAGILTSPNNQSHIYPYFALFDTKNYKKTKYEFVIPNERLTHKPYPQINNQLNLPVKVETRKYQKMNNKLLGVTLPLVVEEYLNDSGETEIIMMNKNISIGLNPELGGRIIYLSTTDEPANQLYLSPVSSSKIKDGNSWYEYGGINDWFPGDFPGHIWSNAWHYEITQPGGMNAQVRFWTDASDSFRVSKIITLPNNKNYVEVNYEIQNISSSPQSFVFNTHPDLAVGNDGIALLTNRLFIPTDVGEIDIPFTRNFGKSELSITDKYCVSYDTMTKNYIIQQFNHEIFDRIGIYQDYNFYTMELLGKKQTITPQEKFNLTIHYIVGKGDWRSDLSQVNSNI